MDESEDNMSTDNIKSENNLKTKPKKRSIVERELETSLTARITSPITNAEASSTSRYGRARRLKKDMDIVNFGKTVIKVERSLTPEKTPVKAQVQSPVYKMHASNSPIRAESPKGTPNKVIKIESDLENQIETIYHENISLSRFGSEEKKITPNKMPKVYVRKDLIQKREHEESITLIKNMFSPVKSANKSNSHINNILERSSEKYGLNTSSKSQNGYASVVKTLDFDSKKKRDNGNAKMLSKSELFEMEAKCEYQVGDLSWSRMGTYPFWPCIITREPSTGMFVKKKLFGRIERDVLHVTFFGDNGRRGWIVDTMLRKFHGQLEFEATREQFTPADKKKDPRLYAAFFISEKKLPQWNISVEEAELLLKEPKRLRIDILNDMLQNGRASKTTPRQHKSGKITRTASDVSLSESLYDTLFSEDDGKDDSDRSRNKSRNKSLDVSEVVTACLDNMAAKTGITKIQRQSHMDRWLQKAKSKTPEKNQGKLQIVPLKVEKKETKVSSATKKKKSPKPNNRPLTQKPYSFRRSANESLQIMTHCLDHAYSSTNMEFAPSLNSTLNNENDSDDEIMNIEELQSGIGVIAKVESLSESSANESLKYENDDVADENSSQNIITENKEQHKSITENNDDLINEATKNTETLEFTNNKETDLIESKSFNKADKNHVLTSSRTDFEIPLNSNKTSLYSHDMNTSIETKEILPIHNKTLQTNNKETDLIESKSFNKADKHQVLTSSKTDFEIPLNSNKTSLDIHDMNTSIETKEISPIHYKTLDSNKMETSLIEINVKVKDKVIDSGVTNKLLVEEINVSSKNNELIDSSEIKTSSINENKEEDKILSEHSSTAHITEPNSMSSDYYFNKTKDMLNGDYDMTEKTSETPTMVNGHQERNLTDFFKPNKNNYTDPEFIKYLEMRQDDLMDQHPELSQDEIVEYLHKTWLYENGSKSDNKKNDEYKESNSIQGINKSKTNTKKKQPLKTRLKKFNRPIKTNEYVEEKEKHDEIDITKKPEKLVNSSIEVYKEVNVSAEVIVKNDIDILPNEQQKANNEMINYCNELKTTYKQTNEITLKLNDQKNVPNKFQNVMENISENNLPKINKFHGSLSMSHSENQMTNVHRNTDERDIIEEIDKYIENISKTELPDRHSQKVLNSESVRAVPVSERASKTNLAILENASTSSKYSIELHGDMDVSCPENKLYEPDKGEEIMAKTKLAFADRQFISNCKPIEVGVSEKTEVEIIANKDQDINRIDPETAQEKSTELISAVDLDDELSNESFDISYAISPLSVKGDDDEKVISTDFIKTENNSEMANENEQNNEIHQKAIVNGGFCDNDVENNVLIKAKNSADIFNKDLINEAGPKESTVSKETEKVLDQQKSDDTVPKKEIIDSTEILDGTKMYGTRVSKFIEELDGDNLSVHSEDSEPLSVTKSKLKQKERVNKYADPKFVQFLEMRQDDIEDAHPELNPDEIVEYLYKTWLYEENSKSDIRKTDDDQQSNLVKGLGEPKLETKKRKLRETKEKKKDKKVVTTSKENSDIETASVKSDESTSLKRWLRPKRYTSKLYVDFDSSRDSSPAITDEITSETISLNSLDSDDSRANKSTPKSNRVNKTNVKPTVNNVINVKKETLKLTNIDLTKPSNSKKSLNGLMNVDINIVKEEFDFETASLNSEGSEVSLSKRKQKSKGDMTMDDPEFIKYLELRQDTLIDENPQLTQDEIVGYLYKTWLYEESVKSDLKKSDEIEQTNLVKGINQDQDSVIPKKIRKKIKVEKDFGEDKIKAKPKRNAVQPYYKEDYSDIEDEIAMFEIMKNSPIVELSKMDFSDRIIKEKTKESTVKTETTDVKQKETVEEVIEIDEIDEVELYFKELTQPKPNLFKGLIREKVCEICEKVGSLVKCKGCNGMFHLDCVKKELEVVEPKVTAPSKGRKKKKKKPGRKAKNLEDSGSFSDEKSQDVSAENMSVDEIIEPVSHTVDAENFEAQLEAKMKELLETTDKEIHYDSYSSDDGIDWEGTIAGKCEIVDVKLKPKSQSVDYSDFKCNNCQRYETPICFVCKLAVSKTGVENRQRCQVAHCHKYYHLECLDHWPQTQFNSGESRNKKTNEVVETHMCPRHVCHTCVSDDPRGCKTRFSGDKLARCVRCPATYHSFTKCLPAGTKILTGSHIICPRHYEHRPGKVPCHVNTGWCFICALGGTLICCEYCPTSFHAECLNISPPEGNYMCEDCETGRLPLYGEMVWVKLGHYRWWPGIVLHPSEIPDNIMAVKHSPGEFVVRFFGQYDHYWVNRGRVFPFQEGDSGKISSQKSKIDAAFTMAMEHAQRACQILKDAQENEEESLDIASSLLPPHYVKLRVNKPCGSLINRRVDIEESSLTQCDCDPSEQDPCGPYSQCLNRMLLTECGPICRAGDRCNNRAFEKRQYPKLVPYRTAHRGWGLKTLEKIRAGQFVIEYVGELIDEEEFKRRMARMHEIRDENFYFLTLDKERMIDAGPKGNLARFMNHCCEPNCETQKWTVLGDVRVGLFAIHDIPAMSEVTFNYNLECAGIDKKRCMCGAKRCAGYIGAKPKQDESQLKKSKVPAKRTYKKRKNTEESPSTKTKAKRPVGRPAKPKELTEIEKDLLIIKNATNGLSSDSDNSRLSSLEGDRNAKALKRKRVSFSTEEVAILNGTPPSVKKMKLDDEKSSGVD